MFLVLFLFFFLFFFVLAKTNVSNLLPSGLNSPAEHWIGIESGDGHRKPAGQRRQVTLPMEEISPASHGIGPLSANGHFEPGIVVRKTNESLRQM